MDAAFVGQWSLTCQSAMVPGTQGDLYYPVLRHVVHVIDVRMFWQVLGGGPGGYMAYVGAGCGAAAGEVDKERRWKEAIKSRRDRVAHEVKFVPFCVEVGGAWGSAAKTFFNTCVVLAGDDRDIDLYHWSSERFSAAWRTTISVLVAKGRARVGVAGAATDWPKRIRDLQFLDHEGYAAAT